MNFKQSLNHIKAFAFDVDGVLSKTCITLSENGEPMRTANTKDGYAMQLAVKLGYPIAIITGGVTEAVRIRYSALGLQDIYLGAKTKTIQLDDFLAKHNLKDEDIMYMGDDIPDYEVMKRVGIAVCPADAVPEIKAIAHYISDRDGGDGCARDIIEQTLKAQNKWMASKEAFGW